MKRNFFKFFSYMLIAGFIAFGFSSCSKDTTTPSEPPKPKTEAEKQADLKEELRTTMKFNSSYKYKSYEMSMTIASLADFNPSAASTEEDRSTNDTDKSSTMAIVIDKKGRLWISDGANAYIYYVKYTIKKEGTKFTVTANYKDGVMDVGVKNVGGTNKIVETPEDGSTSDGASSITFTYDAKTGDTLKFERVYVNDVFTVSNAFLWVQDKAISKPVKYPGSVFDPATYIDF